MGRLIDLTGQRFGRLLVIDQKGFYKDRHSMWNCICDCGKNIVVASNRLQGGNTKSCGCYRKERSSEIQFETLVGKRFGQLIVLKRTTDYIELSGNHTTCYLCKCDCGTETVVRAGHLKRGTTKSCGCLKESFIASELKRYFSEIYHATIEYKVLRSPDSNRWLPYDIYLPDEKIFIEVHGQQHYKMNNWHVRLAKQNNITPEEEFEYQKKKDRMKRKFARQNGTYIEVNLTKIKTVEEAIDYVENLLQ